MMYARITDNIALEVIDFDPVGAFHPDVAAMFTPVPDIVQQNYTLVDGEWVAPVIPPPYVPTQEELDAAAAAQAEAQRIAAIPAAVSPRQIRQALTAAGLRDMVEADIAAADQDTKDWYAYATAFERAHPMVAALAAGLGVNERQLDDLWTLAGTL
jgi:predicted component of type VI protein secretion system